MSKDRLIKLKSTDISGDNGRKIVVSQESAYKAIKLGRDGKEQQRVHICRTRLL